MTPVRILTDSTCNLPAEFWATYPVTRVPTGLTVGQEALLDDGSLDRERLLDRLEAGETIQTSQATPEHFMAAYRAHPANQPQLALTVTSKGSGTHAAAQMAAKEVPEADVVVWDSLAFSAALGFQVWEAAEMAARGASRADILAALQRRRATTFVALTTATLKYLERSGRVSRIQSMVGTFLDVKPIIVLKDGQMEARQRVRSRQRALDRLLELAREQFPRTTPVWASVAHARAGDEAEALGRAITERFACERFFISDVPMSLAAHGGPGLIGIIISPARP